MSRRLEDRLAALERAARAPSQQDDIAIDKALARAGIELKLLSFDQLTAIEEFLLRWPPDAPIEVERMATLLRAVVDQQVLRDEFSEEVERHLAQVERFRS